MCVCHFFVTAKTFPQDTTLRCYNVHFRQTLSGLEKPVMTICPRSLRLLPVHDTNPTLKETLNWGAASHPSIEVFHATLCGLYTRAVRHIGCDTTTSYKGECVSDWRVVSGGHQLSLECLYQKPPYDLYVIATTWLLLFADKHVFHSNCRWPQNCQVAGAALHWMEDMYLSANTNRQSQIPSVFQWLYQSASDPKQLQRGVCPTNSGNQMVVDQSVALHNSGTLCTHPTLSPWLSLIQNGRQVNDTFSGHMTPQWDK